MKVNEDILYDPTISSKAYKMYCYLCLARDLDKKEMFGMEEMRKYFKEGRDAIRDSIKELIDAGFIKKAQAREENAFSFNEYEILK
jgi:predicted transcriptional regulator